MDQFTIPNIPPAPDVETLRLSVTNALSKLVGQLNGQSTQLDAKGQRVVNVATPTGPNDAVNLRYLKYNVNTNTQIAAPRQATSGLDAYTVVFSADFAFDGDDFPAFIVGEDRTGNGIEAWVYAVNPPLSTGGLAVNISRNGTNMLASPITLASNTSGPTFVTTLTAANLAHGDVVKLVASTIGGATDLSVGLVVKSDRHGAHRSGAFDRETPADRDQRSAWRPVRAGRTA
jgi:hypothetical protein